MSPMGAAVEGRRGAIHYLALPRAEGGLVDLWQYKGRRNLVLFLAHGASCDQCRQYLSHLAEDYSEYRNWEAEVIALVPGSGQEVSDLVSQLNLPFLAVPDPDGEIAAKLGLWGPVAPTAPQAALAIADRWGEVYESSVAGPGHELLSQKGILDSLRFIEIQCPECGVGG